MANDRSASDWSAAKEPSKRIVVDHVATTRTEN